MRYKNIDFKIEGKVCHITLNRPEDNNRLNSQMSSELCDACKRINHDDNVLVVVISGSDNIFCSGGVAEDWETTSKAIMAVAEIEKVVIAAIDGDTFAEGLELAISCDIRIASDTTRFGMPQVADGLIPSSGGTQRLPRILGRGKALELILTAAMLDSTEALNIGLVSMVVPQKDLISEARGLAQEIGQHGPVALRYAKEAINSGMDVTLRQGLNLEADLYFLIQTTDDRMEGIKAFIEKRSPRFRGR